MRIPYDYIFLMVQPIIGVGYLACQYANHDIEFLQKLHQSSLFSFFFVATKFIFHFIIGVNTGPYFIIYSIMANNDY